MSTTAAATPATNNTGSKTKKADDAVTSVQRNVLRKKQQRQKKAQRIKASKIVRKQLREKQSQAPQTISEPPATNREEKNIQFGYPYQNFQGYPYAFVQQPVEPPQTTSTDPEIEYVTEVPEGVEEDFAKIFSRFSGESGSQEADQQQDEQMDNQQSTETQPTEIPEKKKLSKKERKRTKRLSVAVLKQLVKRPDVVEIHDVNSADPGFLVYLKSYRNTVPVPRHWCQKRKYLQGKRGIEKPPFKLPEFIEATGIQRIRQAHQEKEDQKRLKQKQRERMQPKMGAIDIDYQVLHDAFFRFQTKPKLTIHGDVYYEGKEFEVSLKEKRPGELSDDLKKALGMPEGAPPPWLINQQRYGPPPSYPNLKIPGLNHPIPDGAQYGFHPGGWGKPPSDETGKPLYGDVFGTTTKNIIEQQVPVDRTHWGDFEEEEADSEDEEAEEEEKPEEGDEDKMDIATDLPKPEEEQSGIASVTQGLETPDSINLKKSLGTLEEEKPLYHVLEQQSSKIGASIMGSTHKYKLPGPVPAATTTASSSTTPTAPLTAATLDALRKMETAKSGPTEVSVTLQPSEVEQLGDAGFSKKKFDEASVRPHTEEPSGSLSTQSGITTQGADSTRHKKAETPLPEGTESTKGKKGDKAPEKEKSKKKFKF
ncbi:splicing factor 3B subunit 2 [Pelomyxa schiedti]|nr:splicing factor 3B subunit 2 [Pelomyxa schiedti]